MTMSEACRNVAILLPDFEKARYALEYQVESMCLLAALMHQDSPDGELFHTLPADFQAAICRAENMRDYFGLKNFGE